MHLLPRILLALTLILQLNFASAQLLKKATPSFIYPKDSNSILFEFSGANFTRYQNPSLVFYDVNYVVTAIVLNDSVIMANFLIPANVNLSSSLNFYFSIHHDKNMWKLVQPNFNLKVLPNQKEGITITANPNIIYKKSETGYEEVNLLGKLTHFTDTTTQFFLTDSKYKEYSKLIDSVNVVNDTFCKLYIKTNTNFGSRDYYIRYRNFIDGGKLIYSNFGVKAPFSYYDTSLSYFNKWMQFINTISKADSVTEISYVVSQNDKLILDTINLSIKPLLRLAKSNANNFIFTKICDSVVYINDTFLNRKFIEYRFKLNYKDLPLYVLYDINFYHAQLGEFWNPEGLKVNRNYIQGGASAFPGKPFKIGLKDLDKMIVSGNINFTFLENSQTADSLIIDSITYTPNNLFYNADVTIYGKSCITCNGRYSINYIFSDGASYNIKDALIINNHLPLYLNSTKFLFQPGEVDTKVSLIMPLSTCWNRKYECTGNITFEKNGLPTKDVFLSLYPSIQFGYDAIIGVTFNAKQGWYDAVIYDSTDQRYYTQKQFIYVTKPQIYGVFSNPINVAKEAVAPYEFTFYFTGTNFTKSKENWFNYYKNVKVINDTMVTCNGWVHNNDYFYNDYDGYIPNLFQLNILNLPEIVLLEPNWAIPGQKNVKYRATAIASTWNALKDKMQISFRLNFVYNEDFLVRNIKVVNDTIVDFEMDIKDGIETGMYDFLVWQGTEVIALTKYRSLNIVSTGSKSDVEIKDNFKIYPNPSKDKLTILNQDMFYKECMVYDVLGTQIALLNLTKTNLFNLTEILPTKGVYNFMFTGKDTKSYKVVFY